MSVIDEARRLIAQGYDNDSVIKSCYSKTNKRLSASTVEALRCKTREPLREQKRGRGRPALAVTKNDCYKKIMALHDRGVPLEEIYELLESL